jgi:HTH-type transcriptional regulator / antitoxin HipB
VSRITEKIESLWHKFQSREYREAYVDSRLDTSVAFQVAAMREDRGWTQSELAQKMDAQQPFISRIERGDSITLNSIKRIAAAFGVAVEISFVPFSEFATNVATERLDRHVAPFEHDIPPAREATFKFPPAAPQSQTRWEMQGSMRSSISYASYGIASSKVERYSDVREIA